MKKWGIILTIVITIAVLYYIELSKIESSALVPTTTLDNLKVDEAAKEWGPFYRVRVNIIDGQTADFSIPEELKDKTGKKIKLKGAVVFFDSGCREVDDEKIAVNSFFLLPTLGFAEACAIAPSISMRWTIVVTLSKEWVISRLDMIKAEAEVEGIFHIDTSKPYDAAFFLDAANAVLIYK